MNALVLLFSPDGQGHCLYSEVIDLTSIGRLEMQRVSLIEFNSTKQEWEVIDTGNQLLFAHKSRQACVAWEQVHIMPWECLAPRNIDYRKYQAHA
jgi:hypothetical protein